MLQDALTPLTRWENFYVIIGSSAGALTGLQFVVIALVAEAKTATSMTIRAFGTPTVVQFGATLLISAIASAPWPTLVGPATSFAFCGIVGVAYTLGVMRHARRQTGYQPDAEDWAWYLGFPLAAYLLLIIASLLLVAHSVTALFLVAVVSLVLLFVGIHNAWDSVTYIAVSHMSNHDQTTDAK